MAWTTEGKKSSPASGTVLADTGALANSNYNFKFIATSVLVAGQLSFQLRNSGNSSTVMEQIISVPVTNTSQIDVGVITVGENERIRIVTTGTVLGDVQVSLFYQ